MKEVFVMIAKMMSKEDCIKRLEMSLDEYKEAKMLGKNLDQEEQHIIMSCHLLLLNGLKGDAMDVIKDMEMVDKSVSFFKTDKN